MKEVVDVRWREVRAGRGGSLARRVRLGVERGAVASLVRGASGRAYADEFEVTMADGARMVVDASVLLEWGRDDRRRLAAIPAHLWGRDGERAAEWADAIDGVRTAIGRLVVAGVVDADWGKRFVRLLHVAVQSLPTTPVSFWRP